MPLLQTLSYHVLHIFHTAPRKTKEKKEETLFRYLPFFKGEKAKGHRQNAAVEGFRGINATDDTDTNLHVEEQTEVEQEESVEAAASYAHNLELKSLRNKVYYQKRKGEQDRQAVALLKEEAKELKDDNIEMAKVNLDCQKMAVKYQVEAEKHLKRLNSRTARFSSYSERKEALVTRVKSEAQRTVQKLTKNTRRRQRNSVRLISKRLMYATKQLLHWKRKLLMSKTLQPRKLQRLKVFVRRVLK